jgi:chemotaxis protein MotB
MMNPSMPPVRSALLLFLAFSLFTACVPGRKYEESQTRLKAAEASASAAEARSIEAVTALTEMQVKHDALSKELDALKADTAVMGAEHRAFEKKYGLLNQLNNELLDKYTKLMEGDRSENRKLLTDLETVRLRLMGKEDSLNTLGLSLADREAKLAELQAELAAKDQAMKGLKDRVSKALTGFEGKGLTVEQRNGKIYVSLENKLLFPSGSTVVDQQGRDALQKLAKAIENEKDLNILVEGHTDTDKVLPGAPYKDNWDLSVMRATSVVRILQEGSKLDPKSVTAGGRGEYVPVDPADKSRNRRIEIILSPDLSELYKLVKD